MQKCVMRVRRSMGQTVPLRIHNLLQTLPEADAEALDVILPADVSYAVRSRSFMV